ncbi:MAG TPA: diguanylate cyclase [Acetivibrio sp.]|uniref:bifunctional diguanylate cyclase/phosphohydrolase n=1 Tax=Acetivibrio sp. TaxID=1872092 RepID=UPI002C69D0B6|nr:diguanylate cyclase [Acetivibrio sp.]HOM01624.1 diguanylate cyclase [Acetivibrio sp.]
MIRTFDKTISHKNDLQKDKKESFLSWLGMPKNESSKLFFIIASIHVIIVIIQASGMLPVEFRAVTGIFEIGLSILLSYRFGYMGMSLSLITNGLASMRLFNISRQIYIVLANEAGHLEGNLRIIADSAPGLLVNLSAARVAVMIVSIIVAYSCEQERKHISKLEWLACVDGVTGVYNHRYFQTRLEEEIEKANIRKGTLALVMIDVDNFKRYNDTLGHIAGDRLLSKTAEIFTAGARQQDIVCRYGGDEFAILMPDADSKSILLMIEEIRKEFSAFLNTEEFRMHKNEISLSVGYSMYPELAKNKVDLIMQADSALYQAKNMGRNNVRIYRDVFEDIKTFFNSDEQQLLGGLRALLGTVSAKDKYTLGYSERVMEYAVRIGKAMGLGSERLRLLKIAALLHDIGKVEIPETVLNKTEPLTSAEMRCLRRHPMYSVDILEPLSSIEMLIDSIKYHHERYDGKGYPTGKKGKEIPLEARILCVADAFDAMLSDRPYRKGMNMNEVLEELKSNSGTQFDPETVEAFLSTFGIDCDIVCESVDEAI